MKERKIERKKERKKERKQERKREKLEGRKKGKKKDPILIVHKHKKRKNAAYIFWTISCISLKVGSRSRYLRY